MNELAPDDPRMKVAMRALSMLIAKFVGKEMTSETVHQLLEAVRWHQERCRTKYGHEFPKLVPLIFPRLGNAIDFVRADLDRKSIEQLVVNTLRKYENEGITLEDMAWAIRTAFPGYRPEALRRRMQ